MANSIILIFNIVLYSGTFLIYQYKKSYIGVGSIILLLYSVISIIGFDLFYITLFDFKDLKLFPFIYLYALLMLGAYPLLRIKERNILSIQVPTKYLVEGLCLIVIGVNLISFMTMDMQNVGNILRDFSMVSDVYKDAQGNISSSGKLDNINVLGILGSLFVPFAPLLLFFYLTLEKRNTWIIVGLIFSCCFLFFSFLSKAQRGELFTLLFCMLFLFFFLRHAMPPKVYKVSRSILMIFLVLVVFFFVVITIGRFSSKDNKLAYTYVEYYGGQSFLNFNNYGLEPGGCRYGDRTIPLFKRLIGLNPPKNYNERMMKYRDMNMHEDVFYTYVGDFVLDFGPLITLVLFLIFCVFFSSSLVIVYECKFYQLLLAYYLFTICCSGFSLFNYSDIGGNLRICLYVILYVVFKQDYIYQVRNRIRYE